MYIDSTNIEYQNINALINKKVYLVTGLVGLHILENTKSNDEAAYANCVERLVRVRRRKNRESAHECSR
jgi:hypothetical protein